MPWIDGTWHYPARALTELPDASRTPIKPMRNTNRLVAPADVTRVFNYETDRELFPPLTSEEQLSFALAYRDHPSQFGHIAAVLPSRTREDCIRYYYEHKHDGRFKTASKRQRRDGKIEDIWEKRARTLVPGRDRRATTTTTTIEQLSRADPTRATDACRAIVHAGSSAGTPGDLDVVPIHAEIEELRRQGSDPRSVYLGSRPKTRQVKVVPPPKLDLLQMGFRAPFAATDGQLIEWLRSGSVLPIVHEWMEDVNADAEILDELRQLLPAKGWPWKAAVSDIAYIARSYELQWVELHVTGAKALLCCAEYAYKIAYADENGFFRQLGVFGLELEERCRVGARVLLTAFADLEFDESGFFGTLLHSKLARPIKASVRKDWERMYVTRDK